MLTSTKGALFRRDRALAVETLRGYLYTQPLMPMHEPGQAKQYPMTYVSPTRSGIDTSTHEDVAPEHETMYRNVRPHLLGI